MCAKGGTVTSNVLTVAQPADLLLEQAFKPILALDQRQFGHAHAIQEQQIEGEENKLIRSAFVHGRLEPAEHGHPLRIEGA